MIYENILGYSNDKLYVRQNNKSNCTVNNYNNNQKKINKFILLLK